ncbi:MAG: hypothetical protein GXO43_00010 [Crenarchaeota archaeon]|nr:hypothetical protein [Thermoproteota archaeon]
MKVEKIVYDGTLRIVEVSAQPVPPGHIIGKPLHVLVDGVENAVINGVYPIEKPVVLGSTGIVRVLEAPAADEGLSGKIAFVSPVSRLGRLSIELDGLLSSYAVVPQNNIIGTTNITPRPLAALSPLASLSYRLAVEAGPNPLIIGCGLTGIMTALHVIATGGSPDIICTRRDSLRYVRASGLVPVQSTENLPQSYSSVVYTSYSPWMLHRLVKRTSISRIIISPLIGNTIVHFGRIGGRIEVVIPLPNRIEYKSGVLEKTKRLINFAEVNKISDTAGLLPPTKLGVIISFTRS